MIKSNLHTIHRSAALKLRNVLIFTLPHSLASKTKNFFFILLGAVLMGSAACLVSCNPPSAPDSHAAQSSRLQHLEVFGIPMTLTYADFAARLQDYGYEPAPLREWSRPGWGYFEADHDTLIEGVSVLCSDDSASILEVDMAFLKTDTAYLISIIKGTHTYLQRYYEQEGRHLEWHDTTYSQGSGGCIYRPYYHHHLCGTIKVSKHHPKDYDKWIVRYHFIDNKEPDTDTIDH